MNESDLLKAIEDATRRQPGGEGMTVSEIAKATGTSSNRIRNAIRAGLDRGLVVRVTKYIETIGGRMTPVSSFRFTEEQRLAPKRRRA